MKALSICVVLVCVTLYSQAEAQKSCKQTNKKPFRYCVDDRCTSDSDCRPNERCLCDGDCGLSCIKNNLRCGDLPRLKRKEGRVVIKGNNGFQATAVYQCASGYTLRGSTKRVCRGIGKWDGSKSRCRIMCSNPGEVEFATKVESRAKRLYRVGNTVGYLCLPNFILNGATTLTCTKRGEWSSNKPTCFLPGCPKPKLPKNAEASRRTPLKINYKFGDVIMFQCVNGYYTHGNSIQRCINAEWSSLNLRCIPKSCGDPGSPVNGKRRGYVFTFKEKVYFECHTGFMRLGPEYRQCQSNQQWSDDTPTCEPVDCGRLPVPQYGEKVEETKTTYQGKVVFQCNKEGYELKGSAKRVCQGNGKWDGARTTCGRVECKDPGKPRKGGRNPEKDKYVYEDRVDYQCKTNYTLKGKGFILCQKTKEWTGSAPLCLAPCSDPGIPNGGSRLHHSFLHNDVVKFECRAGWNMVGDDTKRCTDGVWDHDTPICLEGCSRPRIPDSGGIYSRKAFYTHRERARFYCNNRYKLVGDEYSTCSGGSWSKVPPVCKRKCINPGKPVNGYFTGYEFFEGKSVRFSCKYDYDLLGSHEITCENNGQWNAQTPQCKRRCSHPGVPNDGSILSPILHRSQSIQHDIFITFTCQPRYILEGHVTTRCIDGRWSNKKPECKEPCAYPGSILNGYITGTDYRHGSHVSYSCRSSHTLDGSPRKTCNHGLWVPRSEPSCKELCANPGFPLNGQRFGNDFSHGKEVSYTCNGGTRLVGEARSTCNNGNWANNVPSCLEICAKPRDPVNGYISGTRAELLSGDKVTFHCDSDQFELIGSPDLSCNKGQWSGSVPRCLSRCLTPDSLFGIQLRPDVKPRHWISHNSRILFSCLGQGLHQLDGAKEVVCNNGSWSSAFPTCKVPCQDPGLIVNGNKQVSLFEARYQCSSGFTLEGPSSITCVQGIWSPRPPQCLSSCTNPGEVPNGSKIGSDYRNGQQVSFSCLSGHRMRGSPTMVCSDGSWNNSKPTCIGVCPALGIPTNGERLDHNFDYNAVVNFRCKPGFDIRGPAVLICQNGIWNGKQPICRAKCMNPGSPTNGQRQGDNFRHGVRVEFLCNHGYQLVGAQNIDCSDGKWSHPIPSCEGGCQDPGVPKGMKRQPSRSNTFRSRSTVTFSCSPPFLSAESIFTCINGNWSGALPKCTECGVALGMENKKILNVNIEASTSIDSRHQASEGRLNGRNAWCSAAEKDPRIEIDLGRPYRITAIATQGSAIDNKWVWWYVLTSNLARSTYTMYRENDSQKTFQGNTDATGTVKHKLNEPFIARKVAFHPYQFKAYTRNNPACMRVEIYGCDLPLDCVMVGTRVLGKWGTSSRHADFYYKAYVKTIGQKMWEIEVADDTDSEVSYIQIPHNANLPFVLDVPPKHDELRVGRRVVAPWVRTYYAGTIVTASRNRYIVRADDGDRKIFTVDQLRLLKTPRFCN